MFSQHTTPVDPVVLSVKFHHHVNTIIDIVNLENQKMIMFSCSISVIELTRFTTYVEDFKYQVAK